MYRPVGEPSRGETSRQCLAVETGLHAKHWTLKEFHNVVLRTGSVPLDVLVGVVDEWIAKIRTAA